MFFCLCSHCRPIKGLRGRNRTRNCEAHDLSLVLSVFAFGYHIEYGAVSAVYLTTYPVLVVIVRWRLVREGSNVRWAAHLDAIIPLRRPQTRPMIPQSEGNMTVHSKTARHRILFVIGSMGRVVQSASSILANECRTRFEVRILTLLTTK